MNSIQYEYSNKIGLPWVLKHLPHLVYPNLSKKQDRFKKLFNGVIASADKKPIGLILSTKDPSGQSARIHSFFVIPDYRNQNIGKTLLAKLESSLKSEGVNSINGYFRSHWEYVPQLRQVLKSQNWSEPKEDLILVRGEAAKVLKLFRDNKINLPPEIEMIPWLDLTPQQKQHIKYRKQTEDWYLDYLDPFIFEETIYGPSSLTLVSDDKVVGWVISHLASPETNEFTSLFIDSGQRQYKLAHVLMRTAIYNQYYGKVPNFLITSKSDNYVMSRFLIRHAPHTEVFFTKSYKGEKELG